jgi:hypothetical protein
MSCSNLACFGNEVGFAAQLVLGFCRGAQVFFSELPRYQIQRNARPGMQDPECKTSSEEKARSVLSCTLVANRTCAGEKLCFLIDLLFFVAILALALPSLFDPWTSNVFFATKRAICQSRFGNLLLWLLKSLSCMV